MRKAIIGDILYFKNWDMTEKRKGLSGVLTIRRMYIALCFLAGVFGFRMAVNPEGHPLDLVTAWLIGVLSILICVEDVWMSNKIIDSTYNILINLTNFQTFC